MTGLNLRVRPNSAARSRPTIPRRAPRGPDVQVPPAIRSPAPCLTTSLVYGSTVSALSSRKKLSTCARRGDHYQGAPPVSLGEDLESAHRSRHRGNRDPPHESGPAVATLTVCCQYKSRRPLARSTRPRLKPEPPTNLRISCCRGGERVSATFTS